MYLIISTSLGAGGRTRILAQDLYQRIGDLTDEVRLLDLAEYPLPLCDGKSCYEVAEVQQVGELVASAKGAIIVSPIYNYDVNAAAKNFIELTGRAWCDTVVGFACAAGGQSSYMSVMQLANSLMLDFRSIIIPRFVYATGNDFEDGRVVGEVALERLAELSHMLVKLGDTLAAM